MTTTVTVKTHDKGAFVKQVYDAANSVSVSIAPNSEMTFYVHNAMDILVTENEEEARPTLDADWGDKLVQKGRCIMPQQSQYRLGDYVRKKSGSFWHGRVVGYYSTSLTPIGVCVESATEKGSVQIYPEKALEPWKRVVVVED